MANTEVEKYLEDVSAKLTQYKSETKAEYEQLKLQIKLPETQITLLQEFERQRHEVKSEEKSESLRPIQQSRSA